MLYLCARLGNNVDLYMMKLRQYAVERGIDISGSIYLSRFS